MKCKCISCETVFETDAPSDSEKVPCCVKCGARLVVMLVEREEVLGEAPHAGSGAGKGPVITTHQDDAPASPLVPLPVPCGAPKSAWKVLPLAIVRPGKYLRLSPNSDAGAGFFFSAFLTWGIVPMAVLAIAVILLMLRRDWLDMGGFMDPSPYVVAVLAVLGAAIVWPLLGEMLVTIHAWAFSMGLTAVGLAGRRVGTKEQMLQNYLVHQAGWYNGTVLLTLALWFLGILISIQRLVSFRMENMVIGVLMMVTIALGARCAFMIFCVNTPGQGGTKIAKLILGLVLGLTINLAIVVLGTVLIRLLISFLANARSPKF